MGRFDALTRVDNKEVKPPLKEIAVEPIKKPASPQTLLPEKLQAHKPSYPQPHFPSSPQTVLQANPQADVTPYEKVEKYTTRLERSIIKQIKHYALEHDVKDYEVVQKAVKEYLAKKR